MQVASYCSSMEGLFFKASGQISLHNNNTKREVVPISVCDQKWISLLVNGSSLLWLFGAPHHIWWDLSSVTKGTSSLEVTRSSESFNILWNNSFFLSLFVFFDHLFISLIHVFTSKFLKSKNKNHEKLWNLSNISAPCIKEVFSNNVFQLHRRTFLKFCIDIGHS